MTQSIEIGGLVATIALLLPLAVLATLIALVLTRRRREAPPVREVTTTPAVAPAPVEVPAAADDLAGRASAVARAEAAGEDKALPTLYIALGEGQSERGLAEDARRSLTQAVRIAARNGDKDTHAEARLKLGDLVQEAGDLTTACEHWQIARGLFHELKKAGPLAETEARMRRNGCPTDWVLNDF